jgi:hypothetical protein
MKYGYARVSSGRSGAIHIRQVDSEIIDANLCPNDQAGISVSDSEPAGLPA